MSGKAIEFKTPRKGREVAAAAADQWVAKGEAKSVELMKRFTIDVPKTLHTRIKTQCAMRGEKMADVIRVLLEREFPAS